MTHARESYPDQVRRIAEDLTQAKHFAELDHAAEKLLNIADVIEKVLKIAPDET